MWRSTPFQTPRRVRRMARRRHTQITERSRAEHEYKKQSRERRGRKSRAAVERGMEDWRKNRGRRGQEGRAYPQSGAGDGGGGGEVLETVADGAGVSVVDGAEVVDADGTWVADSGSQAPPARRSISGEPTRSSLSLSPPFPSLDWRESDGCVFGGRYARAAPSFPRARTSVSCAHATLRSFPRARNALRFPRARNPRLPAPARGFPPALARARRPPRASRRHGDDLGCKATPYARMPWRARRHGSKNARTTRRRLGDALKTMVYT